MKHAIDQLRAHALRDLERFYPSNHYWMRPYSPEADFEVTDPLLRQPESFRLTARELAAATAFHNMTFAEMRRRKIYGDAHPARDMGDDTPSPGVSESHKMEIVARHAIFMASALSYSRLIGEPSLIDAFTPQIPAVEPSQNEVQPETTSKSDAEITIPGSIPKTASGKCAVKAAWQIEQETARIATVNDVMDRLMTWATEGSEPDLKAIGKDGRSVTWITDKYKENTYNKAALGKTLKKWNDGRGTDVG